MVSVLDSGANGQGPGREHCVVFSPPRCINVGGNSAMD